MSRPSQNPPVYAYGWTWYSTSYRSPLPGMEGCPSTLAGSLRTPHTARRSSRHALVPTKVLRRYGCKVVIYNWLGNIVLHHWLGKIVLHNWLATCTSQLLTSSML